MADLMHYLKYAVETGASDILIVAGGPVCAKIDGHIRRVDEMRLLPPQTEELVRQIYETSGRTMEKFLGTWDDDFSFSVSGLARFRVNAYRQRGSMAAVIRVVSFDIPDWKKLHIPEQVMELADVDHGMVLVTGTAGSGKSTTQACIIDRINRTQEKHIITLEDPIEYLHRNNKSIVSHKFAKGFCRQNFILFRCGI